MAAGDLEKMGEILNKIPLKYICVDVANGYSEHFVKFVKIVRNKYKEHVIMVILFFFLLFAQNYQSKRHMHTKIKKK